MSLGAQETCSASQALFRPSPLPMVLAVCHSLGLEHARLDGLNAEAIEHLTTMIRSPPVSPLEHLNAAASPLFKPCEKLRKLQLIRQTLVFHPAANVASQPNQTLLRRTPKLSR
ncbi:MAG: hypothetical protein AAF483_30845 [Planctomycetota bacterium]